MSFHFTPGNALGCSVNAHRSAWNGKICTEPASWNCSAALDFREKFCASGDPRCYHLHLFDGTDPHFVIDDNGAGWILGENIHALDDQVLLFWGQDFAEPRGIKDAGVPTYHLFGAYRVRACQKMYQGYRVLWRIDPYPGSFARFHNLKVVQPRFQPTGGAYVKQVDRSVVLRIFEQLGELAAGPRPEWTEDEDAARLRHFRESLPVWLDEGRATAERLGIQPLEAAIAVPRTIMTSGPSARSPFEALRPLLERSEKRPPTRSLPTVVVEGPPRERARPSRVPLLEPGRAPHILQTFGADVLKAIEVASLTKVLLILNGSPGVGKSHLAVRLIDDPKRERTIVVPVAATWRGREDLLGYVNPVSNAFEPTRFTEFLFAAAEAWKSGDQRIRVVVFEEFNLSQPEFWLSDILVLSQFSDEADRVIHLGGASVRGRPKEAGTELFLSPALRFVATMNSDHTTRPLSARVLDRAAIVELALDARRVVAQAGLELQEEQISALSDLEFELVKKGVSFSMRSALSLRTCQEQLETLKIDLWEALDLVLVLEVLPKVRLLARDPMDESVLQRLEEWVKSYGRHLARSSALVESWRKSMNACVDVNPA